MGYIAKGSITLENVNDAYTVSLTKTSCVIHADFDGSNPKLDDAQTTIKVSRGDRTTAFDCTIIANDGEKATATITAYNDRTSYVLTISSVPTDTLEGSIALHIKTDNNYETDIQFGYTIVRESTMLDWVQDWEGGKTKVGSTYIMTPKLFIGKKNDFAKYATGGSDEKSSIASVPGLTGVYIGPDSDSTGIYGYKNSVEIFHLSNEGGMIGGWTINDGGIYSKDNRLRILSNGTIASRNDEGDTIWRIESNGYAEFAMENVRFFANGDAEFTGTITSGNGLIGGWAISENQIYYGNLCLDGIENAIGVMRSQFISSDNSDGYPLLSNVKQTGGVAIYYTSDSDWGLVGYSAGTAENVASQVFALGPTNKVAAWYFDNNALWTGTKNDTVGAYTTDGITMGSAGIRGSHWYIDKSGSISFMDGQIQFSSDSNSGNIVGWMLNNRRFSTDNVAIVSDSTNAGIYMSASDKVNFNTTASSSLADTVSANGGVYMSIKSDGTSFAAYTKEGDETFELNSNGTSFIGGWSFDEDALYVGTKNVTSGTNTSDAKSITLSGTGIRGNKWRLETDGSGTLANNNISWDTDGNLIVNGTVNASSGTFNGTINADGGTFKGTITATNCEFQNASLTNVRILGSIRGDIKNFTSINASASDNFYCQGSMEYNFTSAYAKNIGRTIKLINYLYNGSATVGECTIVSNDSAVFFENGLKKKKLEISRQCVELYGYGYDETFVGWIVLNRTDIAVTHPYGANLKCLAMGRVTGDSDGCGLHYHTFDGSVLTAERSSEGLYVLKLPSDWAFQNASDLFVMLTAINGDSSNMKNVTVMSTDTTGKRIAIRFYDVRTSAPCDGAFNFTIHNCNDWNWT